jgi:hypothetical protein
VTVVSEKQWVRKYKKIEHLSEETKKKTRLSLIVVPGRRRKMFLSGFARRGLRLNKKRGTNLQGIL